LMTARLSRLRILASSIVLLTLTAGSAVAPQSSLCANSPIVFLNVNVVPMDAERILQNQTVIVRGEKIDLVGPSNTSRIPSGAVVIDGRGKYLLPGLADMHSHLPEPSDPPEYARSVLFLYVANGVTTVRSMRGFPNHLELREKVRSKELLGPSLVVAGPGLDGESVKSPEDAKRQVREQKAAGYDLVKVLPGLTRAEYDAIVRTADEVGIRFGGHVPEEVGLLHALEKRQETVEHLDGYTEYLHGEKRVSPDRILEVVERTKAAGIWNVPTMAVMEVDLGLIDRHSLISRPELEYMPRLQVQKWMKLYGDVIVKNLPPKEETEMIETNREELLRALNERGALILLGTDSPQLFNVPGFSVFAELEAMARAGMTPYQVLRSATQSAGEYLHESVGTVTAGSRADLILLNANPLAHLNNIKNRAGVMVKGQWLPESDIQHELSHIGALQNNFRKGDGASWVAQNAS
jgi:imidazolonepropionase-like amidohydrolase